MRSALFIGSAGLALLLAVPVSAASLIMLTPADAERLKTNPRVTEAAKEAADKALRQGPWTVTVERPVTPKLPPNEYYSEAPYFWPDPANPGKMLRKDGERNPQRFDANHRDIGAMSNAVFALGTGAYLLGDPRYIRKASEDIDAWFVNPKTRMNPNLDHAQAVPGVNEGRPTGIIDSRPLIQCMQGMALLEATGKWDPAQAAAAHRWMAEYLHWMLESRNGKAEARSGNNHATWWTAQVAALASFANDEAAKKQAWAWMKSDLLRQIEPTGACPREEARTTSLHYSCFNLDAFAMLAHLGAVNGVSLWNEGNLPKAFHYIAPYVIAPQTWTKQQISKFSESPAFVGMAAIALKSNQLTGIYNRMPKRDDLWSVMLDSMNP